jgi:hypothetical protein
MWRTLQTLVWLAGLGIVVLLLAWPAVGLAALWNVLIPVAPALLVFVPGLWRNICPLGSTALAARRAGLSMRRPLSHRQRAWLTLLGVVALFAIVFWRRLGLDTSAAASAGVLIGLALLSVVLGLTFEWKSGWCSGLCPVFGVETLYGSKPLFTFANAHCHTCRVCCAPCPDSTRPMHPLLGPRSSTQRLTEALLVGGFPGYVWGWFHLPRMDATGLGWEELARSCALPFAAMAVTLALFVLLRHLAPDRSELTLVRVFAAATVACYYWYRIPALFGHGLWPGDGVLIDLRGLLPEWWVIVSRALTTGLFFWWLVIHTGTARAWAMRPPFDEEWLAARQRHDAKTDHACGKVGSPGSASSTPALALPLTLPNPSNR